MNSLIPSPSANSNQDETLQVCPELPDDLAELQRMIYEIELEPYSQAKREWNRKLRERFPGEDEWHAAGGRLIPMCMMQTAHLENAYRLIAGMLYEMVIKETIRGFLSDEDMQEFVFKTEQLLKLIREAWRRSLVFGKTRGIQDIIIRAESFYAHLNYTQKSFQFPPVFDTEAVQDQ